MSKATCVRRLWACHFVDVRFLTKPGLRAQQNIWNDLCTELNKEIRSKTDARKTRLPRTLLRQQFLTGRQISIDAIVTEVFMMLDVVFLRIVGQDVKLVYLNETRMIFLHLERGRIRNTDR
jgi:hypothetical protein